VSLIGVRAPDFRLAAVRGDRVEDEVALEEFRGRWLVLFFYPGDFTFVCPTEIRALAARADEIGERDAAVVLVSTDSVYSHHAWAATPAARGGIGPVPFALASDRLHQVSRTYGVLDERTGTSQRATVIVDPQGEVRYTVVHDPSVGRSVDELLRVLDGLCSGELCPVDWRLGDPHLDR
jgi:alkyl hydroperoxide reductase subunit AhpC